MLNASKHLEKFESLSEKVAQFWQHNSDKFGTLSGKIENAQIMYDCGIPEGMEDAIQEIKKLKTEINTYYSKTVQFE